VDGTPGANDMPGRLIFKVTPDGAATPAEAMRISNDKTLDFAGYDCSGNANGGALTVDASGNVTCTDDDSGGGGSGSLTVKNAGTSITTGVATIDVLAGSNLEWVDSTGNITGLRLIDNPTIASTAIFNGSIGVGAAPVFDTVEVTGSARLIHVATANDDHAVEIDIDAAGFGDVKAIDIFYDTGAIAAGEDEAVILINTDQSATTGGDIYALQHIATTGSAEVYGMATGALVNPILQESGVFGDHDYCKFTTSGGGEVDCLTNSTTTVTDDTYFTADNDYVIIGDAAVFSELEFLLATVASGAGIDPTIQYSTGGSGFQTFAPTDGTNGFRNSGIIAWDPADIGSWVTNTSGNYEIKIIRTRNSLSTSPVEDLVQKAATTEFHWDKNGSLLVSEVQLEGATDDAFQTVIKTADITTTDKTFTFPNDQIANGDLLVGSGAGTFVYTAKSAVGLGDFNDDLGADSGHTHTTTTLSGIVNADLSGSAGITVANGGTGAATFTDGGILLGSGTGAITALGVATNGQIAIGDGTTDPQLATITGGTNLTIVNGAASITANVDDAFLVNDADDSTTGSLTVAGSLIVTSMASADTCVQVSAAGTLQSTGSSCGGSITGTDTHVTFFDGANNPAGDAGLTYNKTKDQITVAGSVVTNSINGTAGTIDMITTADTVASFQGSGSFTGMSMQSNSADPCGGLPSTANTISLFASTGGFFCFCDESGGDMLMHDITTDCTY
jgi:hypothetical protein